MDCPRSLVTRLGDFARTSFWDSSDAIDMSPSEMFFRSRMSFASFGTESMLLLGEAPRTPVDRLSELMERRVSPIVALSGVLSW